MKNLEITAENVSKLDAYGLELAKVYKVAFAGPPWFEVSRCAKEECSFGYSELDVGCQCPTCRFDMVEAYNSDQLIDSWKEMITKENAFLEVSFMENSPQRATLARPTNPVELYNRKYSDVPEMELVISRLLPDSFVWIEDTFANRERLPTGNLRQRGETIGRIALFYGCTAIATRTLAEPIVAATLRDNLGSTTVYIGQEGVGRSVVSRALYNPGYALPEVPDRRSLLLIKNLK